MKREYLIVVFLALLLFSLSIAHAQLPPSPSSTSSNGISLGSLNISNSPLYAGFFAIAMFIIFAIALNRTQLSSGSTVIALIFGLITFFVLYTNPTLLKFFMDTFVVLAFIALILGMLALVKSPRSIRLIGLIVALFLIYVLFVNSPGLTNSVNSVLHINILSILPLIFGAVSVLVIIVLLARGIKNHNNIVLRVILAFVIFLLIALLIPGFASFLFNPITLIVILFVVLLSIFLAWRLRRPRGPPVPKYQKRAEKVSKIQQRVLTSINNRKAANSDILNEYRALHNKSDLTPQEQLRLDNLKSQLANSAWKNVSDAAELKRAQYSKAQLSNNKDLQKLTGFFSKDQALRDLQQRAKSNYKLSRKEKKQLKQESKLLAKKNTFVSNTGNKEAGSLFDLSNAVNSGQLGKGPTDKEARKIYERRLSKEVRTKNVSNLLNEKQELQDPNLNLSNSTRAKLLKKIDKKLNKLTNNNLNQINAGKLRKEQAQQAKQEQERQRQDMLREQARLAQAAKEQQERQRQDLLRQQQNNQIQNGGKSKKGPGIFEVLHFGGGRARRSTYNANNKDEDISKQAGVDVYNSKRTSDVFATNSEGELQTLLENAYKNPNSGEAQRQINEIKKASKDIIGNPDRDKAMKKLEELKRRL